MTTETFQMEVGRLLCRNVREMLESEKFSGRKIDFLEGRGWISRIFTVKGEFSDVNAVRCRLAYYLQCNGYR
jgi:hypothetical protein